MVIWLAFGLQATVTLGSWMGSRGCQGDMGGSCATGDSCGQSLEVGGPSCPVPLTSNSILSYCTPCKDKADPTLPVLPAPTKVETRMGRRSRRPGSLKGATTTPPVNLPGGPLWLLQLVPSPSDVPEIAFF